MAAPAPGRGNGKRRMNADMNVVPYIDVMLVLLIIFMVTAPLLTQGVEVELPETSAESISVEDEPITLSVNRRGELYLNIGENTGSALSDEQVVQRAGAVMRNKPESMFLVEGDAQASYADVARAMTLLQAAGVKKIGFVTDPVAATSERAGDARSRR
ncbi:MAG TPA: protein TolR [Nevskiaceae bacterium]|nr:protein TolR [Nevskiaceae bacterium]